MNGEAAMFSWRGTRVKIMILSESTRRLLGKQRRGKDDFRFSFFPPFLSFLSLPLWRKFERAESMKGAENKGTTIVEGTKTSSLKFQRPAWSREKIKKRRRRHFELKEEKRRERRDAANYLVRNVIFRRKLFVCSTFWTIKSPFCSSGSIYRRLSSLLFIVSLSSLTEWIRFV